MRIKSILSELINVNSSNVFSYEKTKEEYNPKFKSFRVNYKFKTKKHTYTTTFHGSRKNDKEKYKVFVDFYIPGVDFEHLTDENKSLKVFNTIAKISKDFHKKYGKKVKVYNIQAARKAGEDTEGVSQRAKIYKKIIKDVFPDSEVNIKDTYMKVYP